jgi:hypothetical protein
MGFLGTETDRIVTMAGGLGRIKGCADEERFGSIGGSDGPDSCSDDISFHADYRDKLGRRVNKF